MDVHVQFFRYNLCKFIENADTVGTLYFNHRVKEELLVHVPFCIEYAVAVTRLEFCRYGARTLVDFYAVLAVDEAERVVAGNRMAALWEDELADVFVGDIDWLLAVETFLYYEIVRLLLFLFLFLLADEGDEFAQVSGQVLFFLLACYFVYVLVAKYDGLVAKCFE